MSRTLPSWSRLRSDCISLSNAQGKGLVVTGAYVRKMGSRRVLFFGLVFRHIYSVRYATSTPLDVPLRVCQLAADLAIAKPMRRSSRAYRTINCSKPGCVCAPDAKARHGPYFSLARVVGGKTRSRFLTTVPAEVSLSVARTRSAAADDRPDDHRDQVSGG